MAMTKEQREFITLQKRWHQAAGSEMPQEIIRLGLLMMRRAVALRESGQEVFIPKPCQPVSAGDGQEESLVEWDGHNND